MNASPEMVIIAKLGAAVGLKGQLRLNYYSNNIDLIKKYDFYYGENFANGENNSNQNKCKLNLISSANGKIIVAIEGVTDRTMAEKWCNILLYISRSDFPEIKASDEYYINDLIGIDVISDDVLFGKVSQVHNFGAGDIIEITKQNGENIMLIFNQANFPHVDLAKRQIICNPPEIMITENNSNTQGTTTDKD